MRFSAKRVSVTEILPWRDIFLQEMHRQIVHDSLHFREGWTESYFLFQDETIAGYGSIAVAGPWKEKPTVFEFFVTPKFRARVFDLFGAFVEASCPVAFEVQSNDPLLTVMLHQFGRDITSESILFEDKLVTAHAPPGAKVRLAQDGEAEDREWVIEFEEQITGKGGILFHYNRPHGDIYMNIAEPFRRRGLGSFLVQELKRIAYEHGHVPTARCNPANAASMKTLQKAGFVPCGHILVGPLKAT